MRRIANIEKKVPFFFLYMETQQFSLSLQLIFFFKKKENYKIDERIEIKRLIKERQVDEAIERASKLYPNISKDEKVGKFENIYMI